MVMAAASPADAASAHKRYDIEIAPTAVAEGIKAIERATGTTVIFSPRQVLGLRSAGVTGRLTLDEALELFLEGTGLGIRKSRNIYVIAPRR